MAMDLARFMADEVAFGMRAANGAGSRQAMK